MVHRRRRVLLTTRRWCPRGPPLRLGLSGLVIDAICQWCVTSDAIMLALAVLTVVRFRPLVS
jgi:hypothetical protein